MQRLCQRLRQLRSNVFEGGTRGSDGKVHRFGHGLCTGLPLCCSTDGARERTRRSGLPYVRRNLQSLRR